MSYNVTVNITNYYNYTTYGRTFCLYNIIDFSDAYNKLRIQDHQHDCATNLHLCRRCGKIIKLFFDSIEDLIHLIPCLRVGDG